MVEVLSGHLAGATERITKSRITGVSAEVQKERFPNSVRSVVKLLTGHSFVVTSKALKK